MNEKRIHKMWHMIAIREGSCVLAVFQDSFGELVEKLLPELDTLERVSFKMAAGMSTVLSKSHTAKLPEWERMFVTRLRQRMAEFGKLFTFSILEEEIQKYLPDLLEAYRGNHIGTFAFAVDEIHGSQARVLTIEVFDSPSLLQRLTKTVRKPIQRYVIPVKDLKRIAGTSTEMELTTASGYLRLGRDSLVVAAGSHVG